MAAKPPIIAVPKSLYKHFAVLTIVVTMTVAMFADGSNREELERQVAEHQARLAQERAEAEEARQPMIGGLHDRRSYVVDGNPDVGAVPVAANESGIMPDYGGREFGYGELPPKTARQLNQLPKRKMPPVLPPGMAPSPVAAPLVENPAKELGV